MHAIIGCGTTSGIYGIGKKAALKLASTSAPFTGYVQVFNDPQASMADLISAGEDALGALYKGRPGDKLNLLRLQKFHQKVIVSKSVVDIKVLPPTSALATYHSLCVYLQVQQWMGRDHMNLEDWGWYGQGGHYFPSLTDNDPAATDMLEIVRCNCNGSKRHSLQAVELSQWTQAAVQIVSNLPAPSNGGPIYRFWACRPCGPAGWLALLLTKAG